jgi:hypothetical protein
MHHHAQLTRNIFDTYNTFTSTPEGAFPDVRGSWGWRPKASILEDGGSILEMSEAVN